MLNVLTKNSTRIKYKKEIYHFFLNSSKVERDHYIGIIICGNKFVGKTAFIRNARC